MKPEIPNLNRQISGSANFMASYFHCKIQEKRKNNNNLLAFSTVYDEYVNLVIFALAF